MSDLVERLRGKFPHQGGISDYDDISPNFLTYEAASEIERLRSAHTSLLAERDALREALEKAEADNAKTIKWANTSLDSVKARMWALEDLLKPFAALADYYDPPEGDDDMTTWDVHATLGDLRRARAALGDRG